MLESFFRKKKLSTRSKLWIHPTVCLVTGVEQRHGDFPTGKNKSSTIFLSGLRLVIFIGRCLGIVSRNDVLRNKESERKLSFPTIMSGCLAIFFSINAVLLVRATILRYQRSPSTSEKLGAFTLPGYACTMFFVYAYLFFATKRFRNIVLNFQSANQTFPTQFSPTFPRFCWLATITCLLFGITENVMYDIQNLKRSASDKAKVNSTLEFYFKHTFYHWSELIPYHPVITVLYIIIIKCGTWGWVYGDVIAIILMRAIAEKFKGVNDNIKELILSNVKQTIADDKLVTLAWSAVRDEFLFLKTLTIQIQRFIAPLILACYCVNMYIIVINLFYWIAPYSAFTREQSYYVYFAFFQFFFRVTSVTYFASEVHHVSYSIISTIHHCPNSLYSLSLERIERVLMNDPIGICLFGSFMITRNFFLSIVSFIFSTEIVLLQTTGPANRAS